MTALKLVIKVGKVLKMISFDETNEDVSSDIELVSGRI